VGVGVCGWVLGIFENRVLLDSNYDPLDMCLLNRITDMSHQRQSFFLEVRGLSWTQGLVCASALTLEPLRQPLWLALSLRLAWNRLSSCLHILSAADLSFIY
jgi:hypothetical protein